MSVEKVSKTKDFEKNLKRLEEIVTMLEREERPLEESVALFKEGMVLSKNCKTALADVELSISKIIDVDAEGRVKTEKFKAENE